MVPVILGSAIDTKTKGNENMSRNGENFGKSASICAKCDTIAAGMRTDQMELVLNRPDGTRSEPTRWDQV